MTAVSTAALRRGAARVWLLVAALAVLASECEQAARGAGTKSAWF